ncbi:hypothetical protein AAEX28_05180 [Lentisphaerota bacterium WC36G]|nr:hypothetical protein LJT99_08035 [Lentisphaerae bacterium WC36]
MKNLLMKTVMSIALLASLNTFAETTNSSKGTNNTNTTEAKKTKNKRMRKLDNNKDGEVTRKEFKKNTNAENPKKRFNRIDKNNDGTLSRKEVKNKRKNKQNK